jgi:acetyl esterase
MNETPFIRPDVAAFLAADVPPVNILPVPVARAVIRDMGQSGDLPPEPLALVRDLVCPGPGGAIPLRLYDSRAQRATGPLILFFHGGGFVFGDLTSHDAFCRSVASRCDLPVLAVDYRLAPEHPFPAFVDDAEAVARWVATGPAALERHLSGIVTCGDSAGGHLAILVAQRLGAEPAALPVLAQWAFYPFVGGGHDWPSVRALGEGYMVTRAVMDWFDDLCGRPDGDPRYALLRGPVPTTPLLVQTASLDPLRDQGIAYADRARAAGAPVVHIEAEGMIHGFVNLRRLLPSAAQDVEAGLKAGLDLIVSMPREGR